MEKILSLFGVVLCTIVVRLCLFARSRRTDTRLDERGKLYGLRRRDREDDASYLWRLENAEKNRQRTERKQQPLNEAFRRT